jgi:cyanophycinase
LIFTFTARLLTVTRQDTKRTAIVSSRVTFIVGVLSFFLLLSPTAAAPPRLDPSGISGSLVLCGGSKLPDRIRDRFFALAGGENAKIIVIPTANDKAENDESETYLDYWTARKPKSLVLLHTRKRDLANAKAFLAPLKEATGIWFDGGSQARIADAYLGTAAEKEFYAVLKRGGVIGGTSAGAAIMSRVMITNGNPTAELGVGFDLLPEAVVDQHFLARNRKSRLLGVLAKHPDRVGYGIDEGTALVVRGRFMEVLGDSTVTVILPASKSRSQREIVLKEKDRADLTSLRRAVRNRNAADDPPAMPPTPVVSQGSLVIVGGGGMSEAITKKFIELAGGRKSLIVVLPTAVPDLLARRAKVPSFLTRAGAQNVKVMPHNRPEEVESKEFLEALSKAGGIWFGGGRQWRFVDAYVDTKAYDALHGVLRRGGVIGGSSAGASIQGSFLARGDPRGNREIMAEGYEKGFGFLPGVAIDQHFAQRKRFSDMTRLVNRYPQLLGIGIDEATALVVKGHIAQVMGRSAVHFYDRRKPVVKGQPDYETAKPGQSFDFKTRKISGQPTPPPVKPKTPPKKKTPAKKQTVQ